MNQTGYKPIKERIIWIDSLKGIGIFYVVLGHIILALNAPSFYNQYIYSFHLPLFFFVSGYLFNIGKYPKFISFLKKRAKSLLIPYFVFAVLAYIFLVILQQFNLLNIGYSFEGINNLIFLPLTKILYSHNLDPFNNPIWFLTCLFIVEMYFYFLKKYTKNTRYLLLFLIISSVVGYSSRLLTDFNMPWNLDIALMCVVFYGMANIYKNQINDLLNKLLRNRYLTLAILSIFLAANILFVYLNDAMGVTDYGNYFFFFIAGFSGILFYMIISKMIPYSKILNFLGKNTLIILCIHAMFSSFILTEIHNYLNENILNYTSIPIYLAIVYTFLIIIIMVPFIIIINKYFPFLIGKSKQVSKTTDSH